MSKEKQKNKVGRPTTYSKEITDKILSRLENGESLRAICKDEDMPAWSTIFVWLNEHQEFSDQYDSARKVMAENLFNQLIEIADEKTGDVARDRLRVDTRKWFLSKVAPKIYGDKLDLTTDGEKLPAPIYGGQSSA